jgi:hypothetical protein
MVAAVQDELEKLGIRVWRDRQNLRGGDKWDERIRAVIDRCDYVVVFQSCYGSTRVESNVYKEMHHALDRQERMAYGVRFLIPAKLDDCESFEELRQLHTDIDLADPKGVAALGVAIQEDWERRLNHAKTGATS